MVETFYSFGGSDVVIYVDGIIYGEIEKLDFDSTRKGKELELTLAVFIQKPEQLPICNIKNGTVTQSICDIDGNHYLRKFEEINYVGEKCTHGIDDPILKTTYIFSCGRFTRFAKAD